MGAGEFLQNPKIINPGRESKESNRGHRMNRDRTWTNRSLHNSNLIGEAQSTPAAYTEYNDYYNSRAVLCDTRGQQENQ